MKLVIETYIPRLYLGDEESLKLIKETGFDGVDYSFYYMKPENTVLGEDYLEHAHRIKALLTKYSLVCNQTHAPFNSIYGSPLDCSDDMYLSIVRAMESSAILGAKHIVVHGVGVPEDVDCFEYNLAYYRSLEPYCKKFGIKIAIENATSLKEQEMHNSILEALDPQWFCGLVDVGHAIWRGYTAQDYIRGVLPGRLEGLHIHDNFGNGDHHMIPGIGVIDWDKVVEALADIGYSGDFTLESWKFMACYGPERLNDTIHMTYIAAKMFADRLENLLEKR